MPTESKEFLELSTRDLLPAGHFSVNRTCDIFCILEKSNKKHQIFVVSRIGPIIAGTPGKQMFGALFKYDFKNHRKERSLMEPISA